MGDQKNTCLPVFFIGHGAPNILLQNDPMVKIWKQQLLSCSPIKQILVISAHWETPEFTLGGNRNSHTIHDFAGFPDELYDYNYPAPEASEFAESLAQELGTQTDHERGLDHGSWVPLIGMFPECGIPVAHLSVSSRQDMQAHFDLGKKLAGLRKERVLIIASGAIVHNLSTLDWQSSPNEQPDDWAKQFLDEFHSALNKFDEQALCQPTKFVNGQKALPTLEHYLPLLVAVGAGDGLTVTQFADAWRYKNLSQHSYRFD